MKKMSPESKLKWDTIIAQLKSFNKWGTNMTLLKNQLLCIMERCEPRTISDIIYDYPCMAKIVEQSRNLTEKETNSLIFARLEGR